ncbi:MAG: dTDP-4-dehydrorhamnose 3,5-epimerase family protein, partial [Rhizobium pusense]|nr:dTDP-4-dehydrorhamnose 3,5-epimerase family protein [Agrobacterium pusense]
MRDERWRHRTHPRQKVLHRLARSGRACGLSSAVRLCPGGGPWPSAGLYAPAHDGGLIWNDPAIGVEWPAPAAQPILSPKDLALGRLA